MGHSAGVDKDLARTSIERVIKKLASSVRGTGSAHMIIPTVGIFHVKDNNCAVAFDDGLCKDIFKVSNVNYNAGQRKIESRNFLTLDRMDQYQLSQSGYDVDKKDYQSKFMTINEDGLEYLDSLDIKHNALSGGNYRPLTASVNYKNLSLKGEENLGNNELGESNMNSQMSNNNLKRYSLKKTGSLQRPMSAASGLSFARDPQALKGFTTSIRDSLQ